MSITLILILIVSADTLKGQATSKGYSKMESAAKAAFPAITDNATIKDWDGTILREGSNKWTCYPDMPNLPEQNPMCLDEQWDAWMEAFLNQKEPNVTEVGLGYMMQGGSPASNLNPFDKEPSSDNQWMDEVKPHLMILLPDPSMYEGISTDPDNGGPWIMFPDTPYAHIMMPVE
jgi:hypothetical protein